MDSLDYWRLCDEFTVTQAALLIVGKDPGPLEEYVDAWNSHEQPDGYRAAKHALMTAVRAGKLAATKRFKAESVGVHAGVSTEAEVAALLAEVDGWPVTEERVLARTVAVLPSGDVQLLDSYWKITQEIDWDRTTIDREGIVVWLKRRGIISSFFVSDNENLPDYLDPKAPRYASKLAGAVSAWLATSEKALLQGKSPKQALTKWLNEHAAEFHLCDEEGIPNRQGIEDCAKVASWRPDGGAPQTPTG